MKAGQGSASARKVARGLVTYGLFMTVVGTYVASQPLRFAVRGWRDLLLPWLWDSVVATLIVALVGPFLVFVGAQLWRLRPFARNALEAFLWIGLFAVPAVGIAFIYLAVVHHHSSGLVFRLAVILAHWLSIIALLVWVRMRHVRNLFSERSAQ
jgi:hypothetical protein